MTGTPKPVTPGTMQERAHGVAQETWGNCSGWDELERVFLSFAASEVDAATKQLREERDAARAELLTVKYEYLDCGIERDAANALVHNVRRELLDCIADSDAPCTECDALRADLATAVTALEHIEGLATIYSTLQTDAAQKALAAIRTRTKP